MTKEWQHYYLHETGTGTSWPEAVLATSPNYTLMIGVAPGQGVIRTRMQGFITLGVNNASPATTDTGASVVASTHLLMGLYFNKTAAVPYAPQGVNTNSSDGNWLQHNLLSLSTLTYWTSGGGYEEALATYRFDSGLAESFAQRGPATVNSGVYLVWDFFNPIVAFWTATSPPLAGRWGYSIKISVLIDLSG